MKVWRVAHESAECAGFPAGPYACSSVVPKESLDLIWGMGLSHADDEHPSPYADAELQTVRDWERCGFNSKAALFRWFAGWLGRLDEAGFRLFEYEVPDDRARVGQYGQVVFHEEFAREIHRSPLDLSAEQLTLFA
ncbi:hypothetical protein [Streptomyces sp. AHA2]|uniref:hypothetical protein n=1 Tax=Streptomyces sp. AHA2 TaxID=3064526 RepID=UPI002FDFEA75